MLPDLLSVLLALALGAAISLPAVRKALRRGERFCESCGRSIILGERTCDCASLKDGFPNWPELRVPGPAASLLPPADPDAP